KAEAVTALPEAFCIQVSRAVRRVWPLYWMAKSMSVVVSPKAAARGPVSKSSALRGPATGESRGGGAAKGHVEGGVDVDAAGQDVFSGGVEDAVGIVAREALSDGGDLAVGDGDVGGVSVGGGGYAAICDDGVEAHGCLPLRGGTRILC